jgi:hypothetical protein
MGLAKAGERRLADDKPLKLSELLNARNSDEKVVDVPSDRALWWHSHRPHSHTPKSGCKTNGQTFDCSCSGTYTNRYSDAMVFNQCQKGGGNLNGQTSFSYHHGNGGHVAGKTWGIGVYSVDYDPYMMAEGDSVCGKWCGWYRSDKCKCTCFQSEAIWDGGKGVKPSGSGASGSAYTTKCMGVCGVDCGTQGQTYRDPVLVVHDVCQAYIGSKEAVFSGGLYNKCGDEALHGTWSGMSRACD